ncbi:MAG: thiopurine S-methyltransferase [Gammaproteobacteria bacterium]|nr:thiopurine S-methyltransferase [Gammaproteobacteria bacterium]
MKADFWHERWQNGQTGFHRDDVNPYLIRFWDDMGAHRNSQVLVPCCGKSHDLVWLAEQGCRVTGLELSPIAVREFFEINEIEAVVEEVEGGRCHTAGPIRIYEGDMFHMDLSCIGTVDHVYDRGALVAMPPDMRDQYCARIRALAPAASTLLVTLDYPTEEMDGPPFAVTEREVRKRFNKENIQCVYCEDILEEDEFFRARGLSRLDEAVYIIK